MSAPAGGRSERPQLALGVGAALNQLEQRGWRPVGSERGGDVQDPAVEDDAQARQGVVRC
jgi:hypothetical protein